MNNKIVKYDNEMNTVPFKNFTSREMDLFFSICSIVRDSNNDSVTLDFKDLKNIAISNIESYDTFVDVLDSTYTKLLQLNIRIGNDDRYTKFNLFNEFTIDKNDRTVTININPKFSYVLNNITANFTKFELEEFLMLKSSYSKTVYRNLKQFRSTGKWIVKIEDFRKLLNIPESYKSSNIDKKVLEPVKSELKQYFKKLRVVKQKANSRGNRITHIKFYFTPEFTKFEDSSNNITVE